MKKKLLLLILTVMTLFVLVGCENDDLDVEGEVYAKEYIEEEKTATHYYNNIEYLVTYEPQYIIYVKYNQEWDKKHYTTHAFWVGKTVYDEVSIGDTYLYNKDKDSLRPKEKTREKVEK